MSTFLGKVTSLLLSMLLLFLVVSAFKIVFDKVWA